MPWVLTGTVILILSIASVRFYSRVMVKNTFTGEKAYLFVTIPTGSTFNDVCDILEAKKLLIHRNSFEWLAHRKQYDSRVRPGRYRITGGMTNNALVNLLRSGRQEPVLLKLQQVRTSEDLAGLIGRRIETDSASLARLFRDPGFLARYGVTPVTLFVLFIPNTYEVYWNTSGEQLFNRMQQEQRKFWNQKRQELASGAGLTISEVVTLASIIEKETARNDEKPIIAGVYLNRIRRGIPLQADPTVIYAWNDYTIRRVMNSHTRINSPYNTYLHAGLPPGPICLPSIASIDAVLHYEKHGYLYFCAREDLSGYHNFAADLAGHNRNARKYQQALDKLKIR